MSWRDQLRKGSFRGAEFCWVSAESEVGRKTARHDYPLRDEAYIEDLGKAPREFVLECLVLGSDYMTARDKLIAAIETPGSGTLIHPTFGTLKVAVSGKVRVSESTSEGGVARFSIPFVLAGENKQPQITAANQLSASKATAETAIANGFAKSFSVTGKPAFVKASALSVATAALRRVNGLVAQLSGYSLDSRYNSLIRDTGRFLLSPKLLAGGLQGLIKSLGNNWSLLRGLFDYGDKDKDSADTAAAYTPSRRQETANAAAVAALVRQTAMVQGALALANATDMTSAEISIARTALVDRFERELDTADDETFAALIDYRSEILTAIQQVYPVNLVSYTPPATCPALVLAYRLYGDAARSDEIVDRNQIMHPGFVPGGRMLEVRGE